MLSDSQLSLLILTPAAAYLGVRVTHYLINWALGRDLPMDQEMLSRGQTLLINQRVRQLFVWSVNPITTILSRTGVSPNYLTLLCLIISAVGGMLIGSGYLSTGGAVALWGVSLDYFDGRVARATGKISVAGNFLDSTLDRFGEVFLFAGTAVMVRYSYSLVVASAIALGSSLVIPYARAKGESLGADLKMGLMQRPERVLIFCLSALLTPFVPLPVSKVIFGDQPVFGLALWILAVLTTITALHRIIAGFRQLKGSSENSRIDSPEATAPHARQPGDDAFS